MRLKTELIATVLEKDGAKFSVQELGTSKLTEISIKGRDGTNADSMRETFLAVLVKWTGVTDDAGNALECNEENKLAVFEANQDLVEWFMMNYPDAIQAAREDQKKISLNGANET